jgi:hypothetical protein
LDAIEKPTCEGWNRLEPVGTRLGGFREAIAQKMKALCWVKVSVHWGRGRGGRGGRGSRNWLFFEVEHDAPLDLGVHVSFQTNPHVDMVRTLKLLKSSNLLGDDPPPSLAGGLAIETSINSFSEHGAVCSNIGVCSCGWFPHCFETIHFGGFCGFRHFGYSRSQTQSWLVANF